MQAAITRRAWLGGVAPFVWARPSQVEVKVEEVRYETHDFTYRTPIKFGGNVVDRVTLLDVYTKIRTADGRVQEGFGSMPMGNIWAFPSKTMGYDKTLGAMRDLVALAFYAVFERRYRALYVLMRSQLARLFHVWAR